MRTERDGAYCAAVNFFVPLDSIPAFVLRFYNITKNAVTKRVCILKALQRNPESLECLRVKKGARYIRRFGGCGAAPELAGTKRMLRGIRGIFAEDGFLSGAVSERECFEKKER